MDGNNAAEAAADRPLQVFYTEDNGREGLYVNIIAVMLQFFHAPHEPWVVRLPAAVAGVLTVLGLYLLVAELFGDGPGLLAAFLLPPSFWHINFSRIGFRAILAPLAAHLGVLAAHQSVPRGVAREAAALVRRSSPASSTRSAFIPISPIA